MRLVVDASVAAKWMVVEEGSEDAFAIAVHHECAAPSIIESAIVTILSKKVRLEGLPRSAAEAALNEWVSGHLAPCGLEITPDRLLLHDASHLSLELDHQLYHCLYLALARRLNAPLITADTNLIRKAKAIQGVRFVRLGNPLPGVSAGSAATP